MLSRSCPGFIWKWRGAMSLLSERHVFPICCFSHQFIQLRRVTQYHLDHPTIFLTGFVDKPGFSSTHHWHLLTEESRVYWQPSHSPKRQTPLVFQFCPNFRQTTVNNIPQSLLCKTADSHCSVPSSAVIHSCLCEFPHQQQSRYRCAASGQPWALPWQAGGQGGRKACRPQLLTTRSEVLRVTAFFVCLMQVLENRLGFAIEPFWTELSSQLSWHL